MCTYARDGLVVVHIILYRVVNYRDSHVCKYDDSLVLFLTSYTVHGRIRLNKRHYSTLDICLRRYNPPFSDSVDATPNTIPAFSPSITKPNLSLIEFSSSSSV